jgi:hypothetical protein
MSTSQHKADSSLNNLPEKNSSNSATSGIAGAIGSDKGKEGSIQTDSDKTDTQQKAPIDKHGDSWGGGIPGHNNQFK